MGSLTLTHMTLDLEQYMWAGQMRPEMTWWPWPLTMTFKVDLWPWPTRHLTLTHTTFDLDPCYPWPQRWPVRRSNETWKNVFWPGDLDLWPWPSKLTLGSPTFIIRPNFMTLSAILFEIWIKKCNLTLAMRPTCQSNNILITWTWFFLRV